MSEDQKFRQWGVLELFGHTRLAGEVSEAQIGGATFIRIDVPAVAEREETNYVPRRPALPAFTKYYGPSAIYGFSPTTEEIARHVAGQIHAVPIDAFDVTSLLKQAAAANVAKLPLRTGGDEPDYQDDH